MNSGERLLLKTDGQRCRRWPCRVPVTATDTEEQGLPKGDAGSGRQQDGQLRSSAEQIQSKVARQKAGSLRAAHSGYGDIYGDI